MEHNSNNANIFENGFLSNALRNTFLYQWYESKSKSIKSSPVSSKSKNTTTIKSHNTLKKITFIIVFPSIFKRLFIFKRNIDIYITIEHNTAVIGIIAIQQTGNNQKAHNGMTRSRSIMPPLKNKIEKKLYMDNIFIFNSFFMKWEK